MRSLITSPPMISPATEGTKEILPGILHFLLPDDVAADYKIPNIQLSLHRYPIINRVSELKIHIELTRFVQPEKIEIDANERAVNEKSQYCFFVCTTFDSFLNDL